MPVPFRITQCDHRNGVGRVLQEVIVFWLFARNDIFSFLTNRYHSIAEPVQNQLSRPVSSADELHLSNSSSDSDSVGSMSMQVDIGQEHVGG